MAQSKTYKHKSESGAGKWDKKETILLILLIVILSLLGFLAIRNFGALYSIM